MTRIELEFQKQNIIDTSEIEGKKLRVFYPLSQTNPDDGIELEYDADTDTIKELSSYNIEEDEIVFTILSAYLGNLYKAAADEGSARIAYIAHGNEGQYKHIQALREQICEYVFFIDFYISLITEEVALKDEALNPYKLVIKFKKISLTSCL